jgi:prepilin-type N-terminal cleavage/methylation domain-containing protein
MRIRLISARSLRPSASRAFTLVEVLIGLVLLSGMAASLYMGMGQGFAVIQLARENLRATQVLQEKMEAIRLVNWTQINTEGFVPKTFEAPFYATGDQQDDGGLTYLGEVAISSFPFTTAYSGDLLQVQVSVRWLSGNVVRSRQMRTLISNYGLQNYIYDID